MSERFEHAVGEVSARYDHLFDRDRHSGGGNGIPVPGRSTPAGSKRSSARDRGVVLQRSGSASGSGNPVRYLWIAGIAGIAGSAIAAAAIIRIIVGM
jgi:hypothetical protein